MELIDKIIAEAGAMTILEITAVATAIIYVVLASMEKIACWFFGIISSAIFVYVFFSVNYQLEAILNIFYVIMGIYGWYEWKKGLQRKGAKAEIVSYDLKRIGWIILVGLVISWVVGYVFDVKMNSSRTYLDALTTVFAMMATWMVARKILENWLFWLVIDALSIYLFIYKELYFTAFLFIIYIIIAAYGYLSWRKRYTTGLI